MSRNVAHFSVPPHRVFAVLADAECYDDWVVGAKDVRGADPGFPTPGTRFHHRVGFGPITVDDHTLVLESAPPHRLVLRAKARPLGTAKVTMDIQAEGSGSRVTMIEDPADALTKLVFNPLTHLLVRARNAESLRRLQGLAERTRNGTGPTG
jgi:uncharacterized protein YndB with AHSA1/START domain